MTWYNPAKTLICDTECFPNLWSIGFLQVSTGRVRVFEHSVRKPLSDHERDLIAAFMRQNKIVGYNFIGYDNPMIAMVLSGASNARLKEANDQIILGGLRYWQVEDALGIRVPRDWDVVDLIEPQPNARASLKTLAGRMHAPKMQDLPYEPSTALTEPQMDDVLSYMGNDLRNTQLLFDALKEALELRWALGQEYGMNFMSKSDTQVGAGIVKKRVEQITGERVQRVETPAGTAFKYNIPPYLKFEREDLKQVLEQLQSTQFYVQADGKVNLPPWLDGKKITIGATTYAMGIGGLHSTESNRAVHADEEFFLVDQDVASFYPAIILNSGLYPKSLGPAFLDVYRKIRDERVVAKHAGDKTKADGLKISLNGCFGLLGSRFSPLYAPHLLIAVTLTGQLSLLMLIERAEEAGIPVVSANTDGVVFRCPRDREADLRAITKQWEADTGFELEDTEYLSLYNQSVNSYIAVKPDGKAKMKGPISNPWASNDMRGMLMKNPQHTIVSDAVVALITKGVPVEETIRGCTDIRSFVTVVNVKGGGTWRGEYLGKVVRYYWAKGGEEILYKTPHPTTGNFKKVPKSDGCRPCMDLPDSLPDDIDFDRYIEAAKEALMDIGFDDRPPPVKPIRLFKWSALLWFAIAV
jgi:hypothetical protein